VAHPIPQLFTADEMLLRVLPAAQPKAHTKLLHVQPIKQVAMPSHWVSARHSVYRVPHLLSTHLHSLSQAENVLSEQSGMAANADDATVAKTTFMMANNV
jgi:hypothetical protein